MCCRSWDVSLGQVEVLTLLATGWLYVSVVDDVVWMGGEGNLCCCVVPCVEARLMARRMVLQPSFVEDGKVRCLSVLWNTQQFGAMR